MNRQDVASLDDLITTDQLLKAADQAVAEVETILQASLDAAAEKMVVNGKVDTVLAQRHQFQLHGVAWLRVYAEALHQTAGWAHRLQHLERLETLEAAIVVLGFAEYLARIRGGIPMSQGEIVRLADLGIPTATAQHLDHEAMAVFANADVRHAAQATIVDALRDGRFGDHGYEDETLEMMREQFQRFSNEVVIPDAHGWHLSDVLIPDAVVEQVAELGVFGLTIPEDYGGLGLGKEAMCVVTEELSRGYIGVGSLGTRSEIAAELIRIGGTEAQRQHYLPRLASGDILPTAVFTEPDTGSDLGSLKTRAVKDGDDYLIRGAKTWITHAARSDLMTMLVRTDPDQKGYRGLSMLLGEKPRGTNDDPFPADGMSGGEIEVLGYRGMKEYTLSFDDFIVPATQLLGGEEGRGFKQLMETFESARIQTAARAVGVAQSALETGLAYALDRKQFGKPIFEFPRVHGKLAWMVAEIMIARQITLYSAREKDADRRCDLEAGLGKLLGAQVAWSAADNAMQIHGGNGYALEYPISRILCDARILNVFEGAAEIQAQVIGSRLLSQHLGAN